MDSASLFIESGDVDRARSPKGKYPPSSPSGSDGSAITIMLRERARKYAQQSFPCPVQHRMRLRNRTTVVQARTDPIGPPMLAGYHVVSSASTPWRRDARRQYQRRTKLSGKAVAFAQGEIVGRRLSRRLVWGRFRSVLQAVDQLFQACQSSSFRVYCRSIKIPSDGRSDEVTTVETAGMRGTRQRQEVKRRAEIDV